MAVVLNNITGNTFALFNTVGNKYLQKHVVDSMISLGESGKEID
jgi:hypothetical protein